jgi:antitoxin component YwqK of YwqJK toxin-antitoxin module
LALLLSCNFCQNDPLETVERRDEGGKLERWQQRKGTSVKEGLFQRFSADGRLLSEAHYLADSLHGEQRYFYPNGTTEIVERYQQGRLHGKFQSFYETGSLKIEQDFVNGRLEGLSIKYYPNGQIEEKVAMRNNMEDGPFVEYYENGKLKTEGRYAPDEDSGEGLEDGELREYDENGEIIRIADCTMGRCVTRWKKK